jgi:hypothetical protein
MMHATMTDDRSSASTTEIEQVRADGGGGGAEAAWGLACAQVLRDWSRTVQHTTNTLGALMASYTRSPGLSRRWASRARSSALAAA